MKKKVLAGRALAILLSFVMCMSLVPITSLAEGTVTGLTLDASTGKISWDAYPGATSYDIWVDYGDSHNWIEFGVTEITYDLRQGLIKKNKNSGTYYPYVTAYNGSTRIAFSGKHKTEGYVFKNEAIKLPTPINLKWDGKTASWDEVSNASGYRWRIVPEDSGAIASGTVTDKKTTSVSTGDFTYALGKAYRFFVCAKGDGSVYRDGDYATSAEVIPNKLVTLTGISIITPPNKTIYTEGETFDRTGMVVRANYSDGSSGNITLYDVNPYGDLKPSDKSVVIKYYFDGVEKTAVQPITVKPKKPPTLVGISIITPPNKTIYTEGEAFDRTGMVVRASYSDGSSGNVTLYDVNPYGDLKPSDKSVVIKYYFDGVEKTAVQNITVKPKKPHTIYYTVYFNVGEGKVSPKSLKTNSSGRLDKLPTPTRSGYAFMGWYLASSGGTRITPTTVFNKDTTVYARWTKQTVKIPMHRLYNPNSGEHFYTKDTAEKNHLVGVGWNYEGIGWNAPGTSKTPVYRLYNPNAGEHHYTMKKSERDMLIKAGWNYEGIGWYSDDAKSVPLYRQYNPNAYACNHNYTKSKAENDWLVGLGWKYEGIGWYGVK